MQIRIRAEGVDAADLQRAIDETWAAAIDAGEVEEMILGEGVASPPALRERAFDATPGEEGFGVVELILIAAAGRLVSALPERLLIKLFDEVLWPRLRSRFGSGVTREEDDR